MIFDFREILLLCKFIYRENATHLASQAFVIQIASPQIFFVSFIHWFLRTDCGSRDHSSLCMMFVLILLAYFYCVVCKSCIIVCQECVEYDSVMFHVIIILLTSWNFIIRRIRRKRLGNFGGTNDNRVQEFKMQSSNVLNQQ